MSVLGVDPRPFYSGEERSGECDYLLPTGNACDEPSAYEVWWRPVPEFDLDTEPVSGSCLAHVVYVDRSLVARMATHPEARGLSRAFDPRRTRG